MVKYDNPSTILNYLGGLASVLIRMGIDVAPFNSLDVRDFVQSIKVNVRHIPNRKLPVSYSMLITIIEHIYPTTEGPTVALAVLLMYFLFFRQSNLCPRNKSAFDPTRHLLRSDVVCRSDSLAVAVKWSKSRQGTVSSSVAAPALPGASTCPVTAYRRMLTHAPTSRSPHPLIAFRDGSPMPVTYVKKIWDKALKAMGADLHAYSLHSLRRGGATDSYASGAASITEIRQHGDWRSDAVFAYLPNDPANSRVVRGFRDTH